MKRISVVINTLNEESNLPYALRSVRTWADEIIVVDMHSEDRTVEIARKYGAKVYFHKRIEAFDGARIFAVTQATGDWVFLLDADELIPQPLSVKLMRIVAEDAADVVTIAWLNYLLGDPIWHTGWGPYQDRHPRFFKKDKIELSAQVHGFINAAPGARVLNLPYGEMVSVHHFSYLDMTHFISKLNRYTTIEAQQAFERRDKAGFFEMSISACREFLARYFKAQGYKDGWRGFYFSLLMAFYRIVTFAKLKGIYEGCDLQSVQNKYHESAESMISRYPE